MLRRLLLLVATAMGLATVAQAQNSVTGTATFRERIAVLPGTTFTATLLDVSKQDVLATVVGDYQAADAGNPPYDFNIPYNASDIKESNTYVVRAELRREGTLLFTTDTAYPVLTRGAGDSVNIVMIKVPAARPAPPPPNSHGLELPQSFVGVLPCADCEGIRHHVDLWADGVFHMRREWLKGEESLTRDDLGQWTGAEDRAALILRGGAEAPMVFEVTGPATLRATDIDGNTIVSDLPYDLEGTGALEPTDIQTFMNGEVIYMADAMVFQECLTGRTYPVAMEADYLPLEQAYLANRSAPGAPLLSVIEGQIAEREGMEGGPRPTIVVDRFVRVAQDLTCERSRADASITEDGLWTIQSLLGVPFEPVEGAREARLTILEGGTAWGASVGCNQMRGALTFGPDNAISFGPGAATMMACAPPLDQLERDLAQVLGSAASYQITGQTLELFDADGASIAIFEALYL